MPDEEIGARCSADADMARGDCRGKGAAEMRDKIYVVSHGAQWKVKCEHCGEEVVGTQAEAIRRAKQHIAGLRWAGHRRLDRILLER